MYAKIFTSIYQGTLRGNSHGLLVFTNLLAHCDRDGIVDMHHRAIADEVGLTVDEVRAALLHLESPDPESRTPDEEGRRIVRLDDHRAWGWRVVNHAKYRDMKNEADRRESVRLAVAKHRAKKSAVIGGNPEKAKKAHTDTDAPTDAEAKAEAHAKRAPDPEDRRAEVVPLPELGSLAPGVVCAALKAAGVQRINPSNPDLMAFLSVGGTIEELLPLVPSALSKGDPFAYILKAAINKRKDAAASVGQMARGAVVAPVTVPGKSTGALAELADHAAQTQTPEAKAAARAAVQALKQRMNVS
jgi:hypothetical protein